MGGESAKPKPFPDQPDPNELRFVEPKPIVMLRHRGCEYVIFRKLNGSLVASRVAVRA